MLNVRCPGACRSDRGMGVRRLTLADRAARGAMRSLRVALVGIGAGSVFRARCKERVGSSRVAALRRGRPLFCSTAAVARRASTLDHSRSLRDEGTQVERRNEN